MGKSFIPLYVWRKNAQYANYYDAENIALYQNIAIYRKYDIFFDDIIGYEYDILISKYIE